MSLKRFRRWMRQRAEKANRSTPSFNPRTKHYGERYDRTHSAFDMHLRERRLNGYHKSKGIRISIK